MKRDTLEAFLAEGLSLEAIGLRTNRHPSTVAYWLAQHGLEAIGRQRHAPKGGIDREQLEALLAEGFTVRAIAVAWRSAPRLFVTGSDGMDSRPFGWMFSALLNTSVHAR